MKKTSKPWLSVLIPTYNGERYLPFALDSIVAQSDDNIECIVVDDGSTDLTLEILRSYEEKLNLKIFKHERTGNWVANTNYALSMAVGKYICFLHQDDIWYKNRLLNMKKKVKQFPQTVLFLHPSDFISADNVNLGSWKCPLPVFPEIIKSDLMIKKLLVQNFISIPAPIFKRELALSVGGLDEHLWYTADWDFWIKIAGCGNTCYFPKPLSGFRIHPNSQTILRSAYKDSFRSQFEFVADKYLDIWDAPQLLKNSIRKTVFFSIDVNINLAAQIHGEKLDFWGLGKSFILLGPLEQYRYLRDSRLWERVSARIRARLVDRERDGNHVSPSQ